MAQQPQTTMPNPMPDYAQVPELAPDDIQNTRPYRDCSGHAQLRAWANRKKQGQDPE